MYLFLIPLLLGFVMVGASAFTAAGFLWLIIQARLEEIDLVQRLPEYREYMKQVPRFIPRFQWRRT